jgi:hypothetical protein
VISFEDRYNATARPFKWTFTTNDLANLLGPTRPASTHAGRKPRTATSRLTPTNIRAGPLRSRAVDSSGVVVPDLGRVTAGPAIACVTLRSPWRVDYSHMQGVINPLSLMWTGRINRVAFTSATQPPRPPTNFRAGPLSPTIAAGSVIPNSSQTCATAGTNSAAVRSPTSVRP